MYLPLDKNFPYGGSPGVDYGLSLADKPVFSNGDKTVTIQLKQGYKWNDGNPVDAQDLLFDVALIKAAVAESAANWGSFTPGLFPPEPREHQRDRAVHGRHAPQARLQPRLLPQRPARAEPLSAAEQSLERRLGRRPAPGLERARQRQEDLRLPGQGRWPGGELATNPLWKIADGPFALSSFSPVTASWTMKANPSFGGTPKPYINSLQGVTYTGITPLLNAMRTGTSTSDRSTSRSSSTSPA